MNAEEAYALARSYVKKSLDGAGALKGEKGDDGFSPIATVERSDEGAVITITDASGTTTADVKDGEKVAEWAKQPNPPTAEELGAISEDDYITNADILEILGGNI